LGYTEEVMSLAPMERRWESFGWNVHIVDGHNVEEMRRTISSMKTSSGRPHVMIARTVFGKGVSYMERQIKWHYWPMTDEEYRQALKEIEEGAAE
jgi:transketolase